jgi:hypothetical protein
MLTDTEMPGEWYKTLIIEFLLVRYAMYIYVHKENNLT